MSDETKRQLAARLKGLRSSWDGVAVTQKQVADALSLSGALISSWENAQTVPPEDRIKQYSRLFATRQSFDGGESRLLSSDDFTAEENRRQQMLADELVRLREEALDSTRGSHRNSGTLGGKFFYFGDNQPITILYTPLSEKQFGLDRSSLADAPPAVQYARTSTHPNGATLLNTGDADALIELVGHVRAENPAVDVRWYPMDEMLNSDVLTGHVVLLGGGDFFASPGGRQPTTVMQSFMRGLQLPVFVREFGDDAEFDFEYVVTVDENGTPAFGSRTEDVYRPRFLRDEATKERRRVIINGAPLLESDVALIARMPNPYNESAKSIFCSGLFSRGTYGAVRAFTDAQLRGRNERQIAERFDLEDFWMLVQVAVFGGERTVTPDLARGSNRLRSSAPVHQPAEA